MGWCDWMELGSKYINCTINLKFWCFLSSIVLLVVNPEVNLSSFFLIILGCFCTCMDYPSIVVPLCPILHHLGIFIHAFARDYKYTKKRSPCQFIHVVFYCNSFAHIYGKDFFLLFLKTYIISSIDNDFYSLFWLLLDHVGS